MSAEKGFATEQGLAAGIKAGELITWLNQEFDLGHGHAMAIVAMLKGKPS